MKNPEDWLRKLVSLKPSVILRFGTSNARFAPHKPLLLLCVLEMVEQRQLGGARLTLTPDLALRFNSYWRIVVARWRTKPDLRLPFHHLSSQGFWIPLTEKMEVSQHRSLTAAIEFDPSFLDAIHDSEFRQRARSVLIEQYFPPLEQAALRELTGLDPDKSLAAAEAVRAEVRKLARRTARDVRFRIEVVSSYLFTCALTGYRLTTAENASIVDAAHIHERRDSKNDDPRNGLALSKNAHWMFDEGLWSITDDLRIIVSVGAFAESSPDGFSLCNFHGRSLFFQSGSTLRPDRKYLAWHRQVIFQGTQSL